MYDSLKDTHDIRFSIPVSTGSVLRLLMNEGRQGAREFAGAMTVWFVMS